jgi:hypothetical protein
LGRHLQEPPQERVAALVVIASLITHKGKIAVAISILNTPNSIKRLRAYWKQKTLPDPVDLYNDLNGESDRAAIILMSALLDDILQYYLSKNFVVKLDDIELDHFFRYEGPLGSFSSRIEIAYLFGRIDDVTMHQLNCIREMRNACAHTRHPITFELVELQNVTKRIFHPRGVVVLKKSDPDTIKQGFIMEAMVIMLVIMAGSRSEGLLTARAMLSSLPAPSLDILT